GLEGIEGATSKNVADLIIEFLEKNARKDRTRTRGKG
ncbi:MAG TPA: 30S ribosomal protein S6--L-glutamate ligase, partial [Wenzhouxiangella sp.]